MPDHESKLMLGNEAVARGLYEAGCRVVSSYPGTPSTEITEFAATYPEIKAEWAPNEKVAAEVALGASIAGARAFSAMKHVGLNVAADPLFTASYTGVNGGLVIAVADDMGMHSSQNEQDSRHYAVAAKLLMLEPADSQECLDFTRLAFELSEKFDTPVLLRLSTRISHSQSQVRLSPPVEAGIREYKKDKSKYVMMPAAARGRHVVVEKRQRTLCEYVESCGANRIENPGRSIGVIAAGIAYQYAKEALGDKASYLKLGVIHPLPERMIREFAAGVDELYVIEELDDIIESFVRKCEIPLKGGKDSFSFIGEYSAEAVREKITGVKNQTEPAEAVPARPPVLCPGCPHRGVFYVLKKLGLVVSGDIGCYTLGALPPLDAMDTTIDMGASISALHGMNIARGGEFAQKSVAVIGDSTFIHSGITGLIDIVYNASPSTVLILDNSITGMTGHQQNPTSGYNIRNEKAPAVDLEALCRAAGVKRVRVADPFDLKGCETAVREELAAPEPSVVIVRRPCALLKSVRPGPALAVDAQKCKKCRMCMGIGCPAISFSANGASIDPAVCAGCGLCAKLCAPGAIAAKEASR